MNKWALHAEYEGQFRFFRVCRQKLGLLANVGFEYRTESRGYFYVGGSYHLPFRNIYNTFMIYDHNSVSEQGFLQLNGNYLTIDLKYFFHEEPEKPKVKEEDLPAWQRIKK